MIYNIDETSLLLKKPTLPAMVYSKSGLKPAIHIPKLFTATAVFIGLYYISNKKYK
jgi:hypothetical protein